jgi:hypothetical protein
MEFTLYVAIFTTDGATGQIAVYLLTRVRPAGESRTVLIYEGGRYLLVPVLLAG